MMSRHQTGTPTATSCHCVDAPRGRDGKSRATASTSLHLARENGLHAKSCASQFGPGRWSGVFLRQLGRVVVILLVSASPARIRAEAQSTAADTAPVWETVTPADSTTCADGSPFAFYVKRASPRRLYIHFDGGGACWSRLSCDWSTDSLGYRPRINPAEHPDTRRGYFEERDENPFLGFTKVHLSYCTGDFHFGTGRSGATTRSGKPIHHVGARNAAAVLRWMERNLPAPSQIVVGGSSAGAVGASFHLPEIARLWPKARLILIRDAMGGTGEVSVLGMGTRWSPRRMTTSRCAAGAAVPRTPNEMAARAACEVPDATIVTIDRSNDQMIRLVLRLAGHRPSRPDRLLQDDLRALRAAVPRVRSFVAAGDEHAALDQPALYTASADAIRLTTWLRKLVETGAVDDAICAACR